MASSRKKVIVRTVTNAIYAGYLPLAGVVAAGADGEAAIDLLDLEGRLASVPLATVRWIAYVRDFNLADRDDPERLMRRTFLARPRTEGLWVRLTLSGPGGPEKEILEGLAPLDLSLLDGLLDDRGLFLIPPDIRSNTQRLYIPRSACTDLQILGVITTPSKSSPKPDYPTLFPDPPGS